MAWITNDGVASTINLSHSNGAVSIFILKRLLKQAGWTVLSSSDGITYNSTGDQITSSGSGANGMDNNYAWFRIEDPASLREYVFQRNTGNSYQWKWLYSASDGFTGGTPDATTIPSATDEQGLAKRSTSFQTLFPTSGSWRIHIAAENAAHNGVYSWWFCGYWSSAEHLFMCCEAVDSNTSPSDNDPCVHYGSDDTGPYTTISASNLTTNTDCFMGWARYGESDEEWYSFACAYSSLVSYILSPNPSSDLVAQDPHDTDTYILHPVYLVRTVGSLLGYKGGMKNIRWNPNISTHSYTDLVQVGSDYWLIWSSLALPGWPDTTTPGT